MNEPGLPSDPSEDAEDNAEGIESTAESTGGVNAGKGKEKGQKRPFKLFGFMKKIKKKKGGSEGTESQTGDTSAGKPAGQKAKPTLAEKYKHFCFRFGIYFDRKPNTDLAKSLYQADVEITPGMFISLAIITSLLVSVFMFVISTVLFYGMPNAFVYVFSLTFLTLGLSLGGFPFALYNKVSNKNMNIQHEIPFALSYMSVLASSGSPPLDVIRRVAAEDYGDISTELSKVMYRIDALGEDGNTAMSYLIQNTSSEHLRAVCIDISNAMQAGGGLQAYLELKSKELMEMRRQAQKAFVDSLSIYGEGYLSGIVMSVVLVVLMIVICSALGIDLKIMTPRQLFNFFVYFALPFINLMFILMLWMKYSRSVV
ncbi:Transporter [Methanosarcina siciliae C2J]|uniref:Transporter n=1 Tax=Methanosarcina siciliae C2J TaxID=1434118 RepID=A0A0E3PR71_9EURY|nr:type II secretion system F family protein [Methanosarcina siciliae]AKB37535.1 Transporter [Methanosarcina siciliae C2J]